MTPPLSVDTVRAALGERYEPRQLIAVGGMGEVWRATDQVLQREVACKVLKTEFAADDGFRTRFLNEARAAASLQHPGIAGIFDFGERGGERPYLVMELVEGAPLTEALRRGPLDPDDAREVITQVADALAEAHAQGLVHRDIKPGNILLRTDGQVKLTDFGIARAADGVDLTRTGEIIGTPAYLSPEQARGEPATPASDVYALGVVLFECLTGHQPFTADGPVATALAHLQQPVPELPEHVPADLARVTRRALAKDPAQRQPDAGVLAAELRGQAFGMPPTGAAAGAVAAGDLPDAGPAEAAQPTRLMTGTAGGVAASTAGGASGVRRRPPLPVLVMAGLAGLLVVALVATALLEGEDPGKVADGPSEPTESAAATVTVDPEKYVGQPVDEVRAALRDLGLRTKVEDRANPGDHTEGTVAAVEPSGEVAKDSVVVLTAWGAPPPATEEPKKDDAKKDDRDKKDRKGPGPDEKKPGKHDKGNGPDRDSGSGPGGNSGNGP